MDDVKTKRKRLLKIFEQGEELAIKAYQKADYETALGMTSALASYMYHINVTYCTENLESILEKCANEYLCFSQDKNTKYEDKNILYYDEFGYDRRGITFIYLKAAAHLGYQITYVTRSYRKGKIDRIEKLLDGHGAIIYLQRGSYKQETECLLQIIQQYKCSKVMLYTMPQGVVGPLCYYKIKGTQITTYKINLTDHAYWIGTKAADYFIEFRNYGATISNQYRNIDENKLLKLPFYPEIDAHIKFKGFPFEPDNRKIIFSGGALYKTFDEANLYYKMVEHILEKHKNVVFWYAGSGDTSKLEALKKKYYAQVYYTSEREDLFQILQRCCFYLVTFPVSGGLMGQYAVAAGKIPLQLLHDEEAKLLVKNPSVLSCEFYNVQELLKQADRLLEDEAYCQKLESKTVGQISSELEFEQGLLEILCEKKSNDKIQIEKIDLEKYVETYLINYDMQETKRLLCTKRNVMLKKQIEDIIFAEK